jgi:N-acetylglutamate synthase-like GNAT family acetyltransferase
MIVLRNGRAEDKKAVRKLLRLYDMGIEVDPCDCLLADDEGVIAGLGRIEWGESIPYLRPIAVAPTYQHLGIGRRIVQALLTDLDELWVFARGQSIGFYSELGFVPAEWDTVHAPYRQECAECPEREDCAPVPLRYVSPGRATTQ